MIKHKLPSPELKKLLERVFDFWQSDEREPKDVYERRRFDFVFHMTDWLRDLEGLTKLYAHPTGVSTKEARRLVFEFLTHVIPHLNAAGRCLLDEISDPFAEDHANKKKKRLLSKRASK